MKKIAYILALILEIAALTGAGIIHYFAERKLGMVRYLNYKNMTWERDYPVGTLKTVSLLITAVLTVLIFLLFLKKTALLPRQILQAYGSPQQEKNTTAFPTAAV